MADITTKPLDEIAEAGSMASTDRVLVGQGANARRVEASTLATYMATPIGDEVSSQFKPSRTFDTRALLVTHLGTSGFTRDPEGTVYEVPEGRLRKNTGAAVITGLGDLEPADTRARASLFGAAGDSDGTTGNGTDDEVAIQELIDWASATAGRVAELDPGLIYRVGGVLAWTNSLRLQMNGARIFRDSNGMVLSGEADATAYALTSDYVIGSKAIVVATMAAAPAPGTRVKVYSEGADPGNRDKGTGDPFRLAEWAEVGIGSTTTNIVLAQPLQFVQAIDPTSAPGDEARVDAYTTALSALVVVPDRHTVVIEDGEIGFPDGAAATLSATAIELVGYHNINVNTVRIPRGYSTGINVIGCQGGTIDSCDIGYLENDTGSGQYGYGISLGGTFGVNITNCQFANGRHAITTGAVRNASGETDTQKLLKSGRTQGGTWAFCRASGYLTSGAFDTHHDAQDITVLACEATNCATSGFNVRGRNITLDGVRAINCEGGIYAFTEQDPGDTDDDLFTAGKALGDMTSVRIINPVLKITGDQTALDTGAAIRVGNAVADIHLAGAIESCSQRFFDFKGTVTVDGAVTCLVTNHDSAAPIVIDGDESAIKVRDTASELPNLAATLVFKSGADIRFELADATSTSAYVIDADASTSVISRGKIFAEVPSGWAGILNGTGTIKTKDLGQIQYAVDGAADSTVVASSTAREVSIFTSDHTFRYGSFPEREFATRAEWLQWEGSLAIGTTVTVHEDQLIQRYYKDGTSTDVTDAVDWTVAGDIPVTPDFGTNVTSITSNTIAGGRHPLIRLNVSGGGTVTDITTTIEGGLPEYTIINNHADPVNFTHGTGKLRLNGGVNMVLNQHESVTFRRAATTGNPWYQVGGVVGGSAAAFTAAGGLTVSGALVDGVGTATIATGAFAVTDPAMTVDTESAAASDDLDTISGGTVGQKLTLYAANGARTVVLKHGTGNLKLNGALDFSLSSLNRNVTLQFDSVDWQEIARSINE